MDGNEQRQPRPEQPPAPSEQRDLAAQQHYRRGNRLFERQAWDAALAEWRLAGRLWQHTAQAGRAVSRRFVQMRAVLGLLLTVLLVYNAVFTFFPRDSFELLMLAGGRQDNRSWWERFLDTGRPGGESGHKVGVREWWMELRRRLLGEDGQGHDRRPAGLPGINERWAELLRRYGRWGPFFNSELDYHVVSGYGLSRMGDYTHAVQVFEEGIAQAKRPERLADLYQGLANAHYYEGYRLQEDGLARYDLAQVRKAIDAYEASVAEQPRPVSYGNLGWMYFLLGDYDRAEQYSRRALGMDEGLYYVRLNLGLTYLMQHRVYEAFDTYEEVVRRDPPKEVYLGGINDLREIVRDHPSDYGFAHLMIGMLALARNDYTLAREHLTRFVGLPYVGASWRSLGRELLDEMDVREVLP